MSQSKLLKRRQCKECGDTIRGTAAELVDHRRTHRMAERLGIVLARPRIITATDILNERAAYRKEGRTSGN